MTLPFLEKMAIQNLLVHENDKLNFRYKHHKVEKIETQGSLKHDIRVIKEKMNNKLRRM